MKRMLVFAVAGIMSILAVQTRAEVASSAVKADIQKKLALAIATSNERSAASWQATLDTLSVPTPATFEELRAIAKKSAMKQCNDEAVAERIADKVVAGRCLYGMDGKYVREGFELAKTIGNMVHACGYAERFKDELGLTNDQVFQLTLDALKSTLGKPGYVRIRLQRLPLMKPQKLDDAGMLKELRELNQIYTGLMTKDEENWKPIVVIIRTMMDSYK